MFHFKKIILIIQGPTTSRCLRFLGLWKGLFFFCKPILIVFIICKTPHQIETYAKHKTPDTGHKTHDKRYEAPENQEGIYKYSSMFYSHEISRHVTENDNVQIKENKTRCENKMPTSYRNDIILTGTGCLRDSFDE